MEQQDISMEELDAVDRYLLEQMPEEERHTFEQRLSTDASLAAKLAELRLLMTGVNESILEEKIKEFHKGIKTGGDGHSTASKTRRIAPWLMAASLIGIICLVVWLFFNRTGMEEQLFADYFKPDPGLITAMSASDNYLFEKSMIDYKQGNFQGAIRGWDSLQKRQPTSDTLNYFLGVAHLADKNAAVAITYLEKVAANRASFFYADAQWYLGLAYLREGKKSDAVLSIEKSVHADKEKLLEKLR